MRLCCIKYAMQIAADLLIPAWQKTSTLPPDSRTLSTHSNHSQLRLSSHLTRHLLHQRSVCSVQPASEKCRQQTTGLTASGFCNWYSMAGVLRKGQEVTETGAEFPQKSPGVEIIFTVQTHTCTQTEGSVTQATKQPSTTEIKDVWCMVSAS